MISTAAAELVLSKSSPLFSLCSRRLQIVFILCFLFYSFSLSRVHVVNEINIYATHTGLSQCVMRARRSRRTWTNREKKIVSQFQKYFRCLIGLVSLFCLLLDDCTLFFAPTATLCPKFIAKKTEFFSGWFKLDCWLTADILSRSIHTKVTCLMESHESKWAWIIFYAIRHAY